MGRIIMGLVLVAIGIIFVWKSEWFLKTVGEMGWAEKHLLTMGGSRFGYKLIGIILILIGFMMVTGLFGKIILAIFGKSFGGMRGVELE